MTRGDRITENPPMSPADPVSPRERQIQEAAAAWFARRRGETRDAAEQARFEAWLAADPEHQREYDILEQIWRDAGGLESDRRSATAQRRPNLGKMAGLAALIGLSLWLALAGQDQTGWIETRERRHQVLADGSELDIAPHTRLRVVYDATARRLVLDEGEIAVRVAVDAARPFEVTAVGAAIRDIGTRFDVLSGGGLVRVAVAEGAVEIALPRADGMLRQHLAAGEAAEYDASGISPPRSVDADVALAWTGGRLVFDDAPLPTVIATLNRYVRTPIELDGPGLTDVRISGVFMVDDEAALLRALQATTPVRFMEEDGRIRAVRSVP